MACSKDYDVIANKAACDAAAEAFVAANQKFIGWKTDSNAHSIFIPGNRYTAGCYWNNGGAALWFNPYGVEGQCNGPKDCRTLCMKLSMYLIFIILLLKWEYDLIYKLSALSETLVFICFLKQ